MKNPDRIKAIIVAAGRGSRFGSNLPKQFCNLGNRPLLMTTIDKFATVIGLDNIILVIDSKMEHIWAEQCDTHKFQSPAIVYGGETRWQSVKNAIDTIDHDKTDIVMIHDGARPLISTSLIKELTRLPSHADALIPAIPLNDSIREKTAKGSIAVDRNCYSAVQTPQVFPCAVIKEAYSHPFIPTMTDDASVIENAGYHNIVLAHGEPTNIKITNPLDIVVARAIMDSWHNTTVMS